MNRLQRTAAARGRNAAAGFTVAELLVSAVITVIVGAAVYAVLSNAITIWQKARVAAELIDWRLLTDRLETDLRNAVVYSAIECRGTAQGISFPAVVGFGGEARVVRLEYVFLPEQKILRRRVDAGGEAKPRVSESAAVRNLDACAFSYAFVDAQQSELVWSTAWPPERSGYGAPFYPRAVRVSAHTEFNGRPEIFERMVLIPAGQQW
ncbi:MAG: hypothetical protein NC924_06015 [Candidatus Omnitrophica bacterium]|nr:hypothetical protein [Candidatus Omnitrophota bacterium]